MANLVELRNLLRNRPQIVATADLTKEGVAALRDIGTVRLLGWAAGDWFAERRALLDAVADAEIIIAGYESIDATVLDAAPGLRLIASVRSVPQANVDVVAATARGIAVLHTTGRTDHSVAEFTVAVSLARARHLIPAADWMINRPANFAPGEQFYRGTDWGTDFNSPQLKLTGIELHGQTLGIVGLGAIGLEASRKFSGFDMRILAHDPYVADDFISSHGIEPVSLDELLRTADIVSLHARLTPQTRGMIGSAQFGMMKPNALLINTGRAGLIDRGALLRALDSGRLAGVALDVFDEEPPRPDDQLVEHPLVLATPHLAAWTEQLRSNHTRSIIANLHRIATGESDVDLANPDVLQS